MKASLQPLIYSWKLPFNLFGGNDHTWMCHGATSHYQGQCRPKLWSPYGFTRPQWVKKKFNSSFIEKKKHIKSLTLRYDVWSIKHVVINCIFLNQILDITFDMSFRCIHMSFIDYCPASRTTLVARRFRVAAICPIIQVPHCIRVFFYFVWFVFINHIFQFYYELCTYCNILDIYLS